MTVSRTFQTNNAWAHRTVVNHCNRARGIDGGDDTFVQIIQVFAIAFQHGDALTGQGFSGAATFQIFGRMAGDGDVVVVDDQFDVQALRYSQACRFGIVTFLLRTIRTQAK